MYMEQLEFFVQNNCAHLLWKFQKSIYGLKQYSKHWYDIFQDLVVENKIRIHESVPTYVS